MRKGRQSKRYESFRVRIISFLLFLVTAADAMNTRGSPLRNNTEQDFPPVRLRRLMNYVELNNGLLSVMISIPAGLVTGIEYNGIGNLLQFQNREHNRGYWDVTWTPPDQQKNGYTQGLEGERFQVVREDENGVEISFLKTYDNDSPDVTQLPFNFDKRYVMLRGSSGFYSYAILERSQGWPDVDVSQARIVFKLQEKLFEYMTMGDGKLKVMPTSQDRKNGETLDYIEAVLLTDPSNPLLRGEVDDKYQYSMENKDNRVHGWICESPPTGFWIITPSDEFRSGGPVKQDLTSHAAATALSMFFSNHYAGQGSEMRFREGETWKKVFGPVFIYVNSVSEQTDPIHLWQDAENQMVMETIKWPYDFPASKDFPTADQRGTVSGRLLVNDRYINTTTMPGNSAYVGLAPPGGPGSWQTDRKGYQFWTEADTQGNFLIRNVREGTYNLYAWVPGFIGDYYHDLSISVHPGQTIDLGNLIYTPPRTGPTIWEIGIPDRSAKEFFIPDPSPTLMNERYKPDSTEKFRQYGLWDRYTELYPDHDLVFRIGVDNYQTDWFFAHLNRFHIDRNTGNQSYELTTWQIQFDLRYVDSSAHYTLFIALASANEAELQVQVNNPYRWAQRFTTGLIGRDNAIARHGIHGLYYLYKVPVLGSQLLRGRNIIYLTQSRGSDRFRGVMYDYLRFEGPSTEMRNG